MARVAWWPGWRAAAFDATLALLLLAVEVGTATVLVGPGSATGWQLAAQIGTGVLAAGAVLLRRRWPLLLLGSALLDGVLRGEVSSAVPLAGYAVARYHPAGPGGAGRPSARVLVLAPAAVVVLAPWQFTAVDEIVNNVLNAGFLLVLPAVLGAWVRTRAELLAALLERAERAESEQQLRAREAVLAERARITREMHDVVGHRVSLMVLQAGAIEMAAADPVRVRQLADQVQGAGRRSLEELRQLIGLLQVPADAGPGSPVPLAPQPTLADLDDLVADSRQAGVDVTLDRPGHPRPVDATVGRTAYRVVQEALTNAGKHAPGGPVTVRLEFRPDQLVVSVVNRRATRPPVALPSGGHGLVGLRERVRSVGGELRAEPRLDGGFGVEAVLPA